MVIFLYFMLQPCSAQTAMGNATLGRMKKADVDFYFLDVEIKAALAKGQKPDVGVFANNVQVGNLENVVNGEFEKTSIIEEGTNPTHFKIKLPSNLDISQKFQLIVSNFKTMEGLIMGFAIDVLPEAPLKPQLINDLLSDKKSLTIQIRPEKPNKTTLENLGKLWEWFEQQQGDPENVAKIDIEVSSEPDLIPYRVKKIILSNSVADVVANGGGLITLEMDKEIPAGKFNANVVLQGAIPVKVETEIKGKDLAGIKTPDRFFASKESAIKEVSMRGFERNLDLGVTFTNGMSPKGRSRVSRGVLDLRFAPLLNVLGTRPERGKWLYYLTPFTLNANIATGKIRRGNLALNQIVFGTEFEFRRYDFGSEDTEKSLRQRVPTYHRIIIGGLNKSDRDFKQADFVFSGRYEPVFGILNYPIQVDALPNIRSSKIFPDQVFIPSGKIGYSFIPVVGFEFGRTYFRDNPARAVKPSKTVRRFYTGATFKLDVTQFLTFSIEEKFYVRGEVDKDRLENYFKVGVDVFIVGKSFSGVGQSLFFAYELGKQPPFATPEVNVLKIGYRIRGDGWFNRIR